MDRLTFAEAKSAGPFLDGCNVRKLYIFQFPYYLYISLSILFFILQIYLAGFAPNQRDKLNKILNVGSATRLDDITDALTHVIVGDENRAANELKLMKSKGLWYNIKLMSKLISMLFCNLILLIFHIVHIY